jgi:mRNA interferase RelE/StbE
MYEIRYSRAAEKYFKKLKEKGLKEAYRKAIIKISNDPYIGQLKSGDLIGIYCFDVYYNKTNHEIAYYIYEEEDHFVVILIAGTRENFYEELKRYINL